MIHKALIRLDNRQHTSGVFWVCFVCVEKNAKKTHFSLDYLKIIV